jgi:FAD/FMN-containing dehydrogenase
MGGSPTGEHGVGLEKREFLPLIFSADEMEAQRQLRDALDPTGLCNPLKVLPSGGECVELRVAGKQVAL